MSNSDSLIHIRVGRKVKQEMQKLIDGGLFTNQTEIAREAIRSTLLQYGGLNSINEKINANAAANNKVKKIKKQERAAIKKGMKK